MTKEEVKHWLEIELKMWEDECKSEHPIKEALSAVIKALDQEPCEDAISRADVKKYLAAPDTNGDRIIYESDLDLLPSVQPRAKTGHWIDTGSGQMCSSCGEIQYGYDSFRRYCASCGCRIVEPQERSDKE